MLLPTMVTKIARERTIRGRLLISVHRSPRTAAAQGGRRRQAPGGAATGARALATPGHEKHSPEGEYRPVGPLGVGAPQRLPVDAKELASAPCGKTGENGSKRRSSLHPLQDVARPAEPVVVDGFPKVHLQARAPKPPLVPLR